jgi:hypothetical protein
LNIFTKFKEELATVPNNKRKELMNEFNRMRTNNTTPQGLEIAYKSIIAKLNKLKARTPLQRLANGEFSNEAYKRVHALLRPLYNGYYRIDDPAGSSWLAVNTFDPAESDFSHIPAASTAPWNFTQGVAVSPWMNPWRLLALAALLLSALEWALFHRRRTE